MNTLCVISLLLVLLLSGCASNHDGSSGKDAISGISRRANEADLNAIEDLAEQRRVKYAQAQPMYFRQSEGAREKHLLYLRDQLKLGKQFMLVHETEGHIDGFLMANLSVKPPPIYEPGGKTLMIDDFVVSDSRFWSTIGGALLRDVERRAKEQGAVQMVAVCGDSDGAKKSFLKREGLTIASSWFTRPLK
jgi:hypothetical protein